MLFCLKIVKISEGETRIDFIFQTDAGGSVPTFVANYYASRFLSYPSKIQEKFEKQRHLSDWDEKDGRAVGEALLIKVDAESKKVRPTHMAREEARMRALFAQYRGLKEAGERYEWLEKMLARVVMNRIR
jgi:hypothetical protein